MHCERFENDARQAVARFEHLFAITNAERRDDAKDDRNDSRPAEEARDAKFLRRRVAKATGKRRNAPSVGERSTPSGKQRVTDCDRGDQKRKQNNGFEHVRNRRPTGDIGANRPAKERDRARKSEESEPDDEEKAFFKRRAASQADVRLATIRNGKRDDGEQTRDPIPIERIEAIVKKLGVERVRLRIGGFRKERRSKSFVDNFFRSKRGAEGLGTFGDGAKFGGETSERRVETFGAIRRGNVAIRRRGFEERFRRGTFVNA